jgi:hypothetical protein
MLIVVTILGSVVPKRSKSNTKRALCLIICLITDLIVFDFSYAKPPHQLEFLLSDSEGACQQSIALYEGSRLTMQFPNKVRVAVPSQDQLLDIFISGSLIVINPTQGRIQTQNKVSLTAELNNGRAFICTFDLFPKRALRESSAPVELIRVKSSNQLRKIESDSIDLLIKHLTLSTQQDQASHSPHLATVVHQWTQRVIDQSRHSLMSAEDFQISSLTPVRAQSHLIYLIVERVIRAQQTLYLRISLQNRSQETFHLRQIHYVPKGSTKAHILWGMEQIDHPLKDVIVQADDPPILIGLSAPLSLLSGSPLYFTSADGRIVALHMQSFSELNRVK